MPALLHYPGAKWGLAPWLISHFPPHQRYVEPYCGSAAVLLSKPPVAFELINDVAGDVVNLFRVIRDHGEALAARIALTPYAHDEYRAAFAPTDDPMEQARRFVIRSWQTHGAQQTQGWRRQGAGNAYGREWRSVPERIRAVIDRLSQVEIENDDALRVIARCARADTLIYADPPYVPETRARRMYMNEMTTEAHAALIAALRAHPGPVVLSGYACPLYDDALTGWRRIDKRMVIEKGLSRTESIWCNPRCEEQAQSGLFTS